MGIDGIELLAGCGQPVPAQHRLHPRRPRNVVLAPRVGRRVSRCLEHLAGEKGGERRWAAVGYSRCPHILHEEVAPQHARLAERGIPKVHKGLCERVGVLSHNLRRQRAGKGTVGMTRRNARCEAGLRSDGLRRTAARVCESTIIAMSSASAQA
eukprot:scaffold8981_cov108-Isochrysis_galbana.AAC.1